MDQEKGYSFDYNLYDECYDFDLARRWDQQRLWWGPPRSRASAIGRGDGSGSGGYEPHHMDGSPCGGTSVLSAWVNRTEVKKALHVAEDAYFFNGDNGDGFVYNITEPSLVPYYRHLASETKLRVLIYNGQADACVPYNGNEQWISMLEEQGILQEVKAWEPWFTTHNRTAAGYITRYKPTGSQKDFVFQTVRLAGHMVPQFQPEAGFTMFSHFLAADPQRRGWQELLVLCSSMAVPWSQPEGGFATLSRFWVWPG